MLNSLPSSVQLATEARVLGCASWISHLLFVRPFCTPNSFARSWATSPRHLGHIYPRSSCALQGSPKLLLPSLLGCLTAMQRLLCTPGLLSKAKQSVVEGRFLYSETNLKPSVHRDWKSARLRTKLAHCVDKIQPPFMNPPPCLAESHLPAPACRT